MAVCVCFLFKATFAIQKCLLDLSAFSQLSSRERIYCWEVSCLRWCTGHGCVASINCNSSPCLKFWVVGGSVAISQVHHKACHVKSRHLQLDQLGQAA